MQVDLRLFKNNYGTLRCIITEYDCGENLRDVKPYVSNQDFGRIGAPSDLDAIDVPAFFRDRFNPERIYQVQFFHPTGNSLVQTFLLSSPAACQLKLAITCRENRFYHPLPALPHIHWF